MLATDKLIRVYSVTDPTEAELIKNMLRQNDIECALDGAHQAGFAGVFRIGIMVWGQDLERAEKVLRGYRPAAAA